MRGLHKPYQNPNILHFASISVGYLPTFPSIIHVGVVTLTPKISFKNRSCSFEITSIFSHPNTSQPYKRIGCTHFSKSSNFVSSGKLSCRHFLKAILNHANSLVSACPLYVNRHPRTLSITGRKEGHCL